MYDTIFQLSTLLVAPFWGLMIFAPKWRWTQKIIGSPWIAAPPALIFAALTLPTLPDLLPKLLQPNLGIIMGMFSTPQSMTAVWMYFLAFDLFIGRWIYLETRQRNRNLAWSGILLLFTLLMGPLGYLVYLIDRTFFSSVKSGTA